MRSIPEILKRVKAAGGAVDITLGEPTEEGCVFWLGPMAVIVSNGDDWDHVSASCKTRTPREVEMKRLRHMCFRPDEWVVEFHPPRIRGVLMHPNSLHLWRPQKADLPIPPEWGMGEP